MIAGKGSQFQDIGNPQPVVQVGASGSQGLIEITDMLFTTVGPGMFLLDLVPCLEANLP